MSLKNTKNFVITSAAEFIAAITQHIPEKNFQLVGYYGWYSNRMRGDRRKREQQVPEQSKENDIEVIDISNHKSKRIPSPTWRECTQRALASRAHQKNMGGRSAGVSLVTGRVEDHQLYYQEEGCPKDTNSFAALG